MRKIPLKVDINARVCRRLALFTFLTRAILFWEIFWPRVMPLLAIIASFLLLAFLDLLPNLSYRLHLAILIIFAILFLLGFRHVLRGGYCVTHDTVNHRIERDSSFEHRPLSALSDGPLELKPGSVEEILWHAHVLRMASLIPSMRIKAPSPCMPRRDPAALRIIILLMLIIGCTVGGAEAGPRLERALLPQKIKSDSDVATLEVWITPPDYTQKPPLFLDGKKNIGVVKIPTGSKVLAQISAFEGKPNLIIGNRVEPFSPQDKKNIDDGWIVEIELGKSDLGSNKLAITRGDEVVRVWNINVIEDLVPEVSFRAPPKNKGGGILSLEYEAKDDYGLSNLRLVVQQSQGWLLPNGKNFSAFELPIAKSEGGTWNDTVARDFSGHPWAGMVVKMLIRAVDGIGQESGTDKILIALPERIFNHPVARQLVELRKILNRPDDKAIMEVISRLTLLCENPKHFYDDLIVFLALTSAQARLRHNKNLRARGEVQHILWETALRIEDGKFSVAERNLDKIQEELAKSLRGGLGIARLEPLLDRLQLAMEHYARALTEHLKRKGLALPENFMSGGIMNSRRLNDMLHQARELSHSGSREGARRMLSQLNEALKALRNSVRLAPQRQDVMVKKRVVNGLRSMVSRQQILLDQTFRYRQQRRSTGQTVYDQNAQMGEKKSKQDPVQLALDQEKLREDLSRLMQKMSTVLNGKPEGLGRAKRAMSRARDSLHEADVKEALQNQANALNELRITTQKLVERLATRQGPAISLGEEGGRQERNTHDLFGRRFSGESYGENQMGLKIPDQRDLMKSRQILKELRRRSGEYSRPRSEREYIERLIKRF